MTKLGDVKTALDMVAPALSNKEFIPSLTCFCFVSNTVFAYDDLIAIRTPFAAAIDGGVRGKLLLDMVSSVEDDDVDVSITVIGTDQLKFEISSMGLDLELPLLSKEQFILDYPDPSANALQLDLSVETIKKIDYASTLATQDPSSPEYMGVTVIIDKEFTLNSTDRKTVTRLRADMPDGVLMQKFILPLDFCKALSHLMQSTERGAMLYRDVDQGCFIADFGDGISAFSRMMPVDPVDFNAVLARHYDEKKVLASDIPEGFPQMVKRADMLMAGANAVCNLSHDAKILSLDSSSTFGELHEKTDLSELIAVKDMVCAPDLLARGLEYANEIGFTDRTIFLRSEDYLHLLLTKSSV